MCVVRKYSINVGSFCVCACNLQSDATYVYASPPSQKKAHHAFVSNSLTQSSISSGALLFCSHCLSCFAYMFRAVFDVRARQGQNIPRDPGSPGERFLCPRGKPASTPLFVSLSKRESLIEPSFRFFYMSETGRQEKKKRIAGSTGSQNSQKHRVRVIKLTEA